MSTKSGVFRVQHEHARDDDPTVSEEEYVDASSECRGHPFLVLRLKAIEAKQDTILQTQKDIMGALMGDIVKEETGIIPWRRSVDKKIKEVNRIAAVIGGGLVTFAGVWLWALLTHQATVTMVGK